MSLVKTTTYKNALNPVAMSVALGLGLAALPAMAADEQAPVTEEKKLAVETITVTARHKVESLQSTPVAVSAFGADQLKEERIIGLEDISSRVPGFQMNAYTSAEPELFMRGIGSDIESAGAGAAIGMYVDGVYISRGTGSAMDLFDLESVEVLRGPQGTLYGKNVVGGAINFITKRPTDGDAEGSAELSFGDYGLFEAKGFVSGGLSDSVAGKISLSTSQRDGYGKNTHTGNDADWSERSSIRGQLLINASDATEVLLTAATSTTEGAPRMKHIAYSEGRNAAFISANPRDDASSVDNTEDADSSSFSMQVTSNFESVTLTSISAYRSNEYDIFENAAAGLVDHSQTFDPWGDPANNTVASPEALAALQPDDAWLSRKAEESSQVSQEFRLASNAEGDFSWIAGAFYMVEDIERAEDVDYWFDTQWGTTTGRVSNTTDNKTTSVAVFGQATYELSDKLSITAGLRWSEDEKEFSGTASGRRFDNWDNLHEDINGNRVASYAFSTSDSWDEWTPSLNIDYQATDDVFIYGSIAKGYKSGGYNGEGMEKEEEAIVAFRPELAWNYEFGFKTQSFEDRLRLNGAVFFTEYTDIQNQVWVETGENTPDNLQVFNGTGEAKGFELEATALFTENFHMSGSYGYLRTEFTDDFIVDGENYKGNDMRRTPKHSFNLNATYEWEVSDLGESSFRLGYQYTSDFFFDNDNNPLTKVGSQTNLDAVWMLRSFDDTWSVQVWAKNITDELNVASTTLYAAYDDTVYNAYKPPRTVGVTVTYNF